MKKRVTPEVLRELAEQVRNGMLASLEIKQTGDKRGRWTAEYELAKAPYASSGNFANRHYYARLLESLAGSLEQRQIAYLYVHLADPISYNIHFCYSLSVTPTEEE